MPPSLFRLRAARATRSLVRSVRPLGADRSGTVVVVFAIALIPLMFGLLFAVDYARVTSTQRAIQASLDAAVLAGVNSEASDKITVAQRFFAENTANGPVSSSNATFSIGGDGTLSGTAEAVLPLLTGGFLQNKSTTINATAAAYRAGTRYESFTFTPMSAQGTFDKDVYVVTRDAAGNIVNSDLALAYSYNAATNTRSTAPMTGIPITVTLPAYESVVMMMRVWSQNPGTRTGAYVDYYSDSPLSRLRTTGTCETGQMNNWEDGGDSNYVDFVYTMSCKPLAGSNTSWLVK